MMWHAVGAVMVAGVALIIFGMMVTAMGVKEAFLISVISTALTAMFVVGVALLTS